MLKAYPDKDTHPTLLGFCPNLLSRRGNKTFVVFTLVTLLFSISISPVDAQIYKYRKPNGKLLFTDTEILDSTYVLLNPLEISINKKTKSDPVKFEGYIYRAAREYGVEPSLIKAIIKTESDFDPNAKSKAGAEGLMQLMPQTARMYNVQNSYNSEQNIMAGTRHIKYLLGKYKDDLILALAAYNAGESAVNRHNGVPPYPETQRYVQKVQAFKKHFDEN